MRAGLRAHGGRLVATGVAVALGVALLTGSLVFVEGIRRAQHDLSSGVSGAVDLVVESGTAFGFGDVRIPEESLEAVRAVEGVAAAFPTLLGWARLVGPGGEPVGGLLHSGIAASIAPDDLTFTPLELRSGRLPMRDGEVAVDAASARVLGAGRGEVIRVTLPVGTEDFLIVGTVGYAGSDGIAGASFALFDLATARRVLDAPAGFTSIAVVAATDTVPLELGVSLAAVLPDGVEVVPVAEGAGWGFGLDDRVLVFLRTMLIAVTGIVLIAAGLLVHGTFAILNEQRVRESALLRIVGATRRQIATRLVGEATIVAGAASAIGIAAGVGLARLARWAAGAAGWEFPVGAEGIRAGTIATGLAVGVLVGIGATLPTVVASARISPLSGLHGADAGSGSSRSRRVVAALLAMAGAVTLVGAVAGEYPPLAAAGGALVLIGAVLALPMVFRAGVRFLGSGHDRLVWRLAARGLGRRPQRAAAAATALLIAVALVSMLATISASAGHSIDRAVRSEILADLQVQAAGSWDPTRGGLPSVLADRLRDLEETAAVAAFRLGSWRTPGDASNHALFGVDPAAAALLDWRIVAGDFGALRDGGVALRAEHARKLEVGLGDRFALLVPDGRVAEFTVVALHDSTVVQLSVVISMQAYEDLYTRALDYFVLIAGMEGSDPAEVRSAVAGVVAAFPGAEVGEVADLAADLAGRARAVIGGFALLLALAAVIGVLAVVNSLLLSISERRREIGLLRTIGMSRAGVRRLIHLESALLAVVAAAAGILVGVPLGTVMATSASRGLTPHVPWVVVLLYPAIAVALAGLAAMWPARQAARVDLLEAIGYE